jgi:hypothetical protein
MTRGAGDELERAVRDRFAGFGGHVEVEERASRRWSSISFSGERHRLRLRILSEAAGAPANRFIAGLDARGFTLRGHILADIAVTGDLRAEDGSVRLIVEALTVEAG